jgi:peptidyl-prolyl cis-trans isomerase B (cyclophilin B)
MKKIVTSFLLLFTLSTAYAQKNKVKIETEYGNIILMLYDFTPLNTNNMVKQAKAHVYDSTLFHRCIPQFVIQGGDPDSKHATAGQALGNGGLSYTIPAEFSPSAFHKRGAVGVARDNTPDKSGSATQFYIVVGRPFTEEALAGLEKQGKTFTPEQRAAYIKLGGTPHLDGGYTVFGEVVEGMEIVDKIANEARDGNDRPYKDIRMLSVSVMKKKKKFLFF